MRADTTNVGIGIDLEFETEGKLSIFNILVT